MSDARFDAVCGRCFAPAGGGYVLSCSDFLCQRCGAGAGGGRAAFTCPSCRRQNVKMLSLTGNLPLEVVNNLADYGAKPVVDAISGLKFQVKHYKAMINRIVARSQRDATEYERKIAFLEAQHGTAVQYPAQQQMTDNRPLLPTHHQQQQQQQNRQPQLRQQQQPPAPHQQQEQRPPARQPAPQPIPPFQGQAQGPGQGTKR